MTDAQQDAQALIAASQAQDVAEQNLPAVLREFGTTGLQRSGGMISEEYLTELQGSRGVKVFKEMETNDPIASAMSFSLGKIITRLPWEIQEPDEATPDEKRATAMVQSAFDDMETPWSNVLEDIMSMIPYGWAFLETNYKIRMGPDSAEDWRRSQFTDGMFGWKSFRIRSQDTLIQWVYDQAGNLLGMQQQDPAGGGVRTIPLKKALLFRTTTAKDNPEGRSMLRGAYRPWFFKKRIEEYEAVGIERDLAGLPKAFLPPEYFAPGASADKVATRELMAKLVSDIRMDASGGLVIPRAYDQNGNSLIDVELMASPGQKQIDTNAVIKRKSEEMAMSILMDFLMLGHQGVGSFSLGTAKIDLWTMSVDALARGVSETFGAFAIKPLLKLNRITGVRPPKLVYGDVANTDLAELGAFIEQMVNAGLLTAGPELESHIRELAKLPRAEELPYAVAPTQ